MRKLSGRAGERGPRGFFSIGIYKVKSACNEGGLWRSAYCYGAASVFTIGRPFRQEAADTPKAWKSVPMVRYESVDDLIAHLPHGCPLIGVELDDRSLPLTSFCHPERACYLLGREDCGLPESVRARCHLLVQMGGLKSCLNVASAGSVLMYDRLQKAMSR